MNPERALCALRTLPLFLLIVMAPHCAGGDKNEREPKDVSTFIVDTQAAKELPPVSLNAIRPQPTSPHPDTVRALLKLHAAGDKNAFPPHSGDVAGLGDAIVMPPNPDHSVAMAKGAAVAGKKKVAKHPKVLVVLVEFADKKFDAGMNEHFRKLFFADGKVPGIAPNGSVKSFYKEASNGQVEMDGDVFGPYTLPHSLAYYGNGGNGMQAESPNSRTMASDAWSVLVKNQPNLNLAEYDNDGIGWVNTFVVVQPSDDGARTHETNKDNIWPIKWYMDRPESIGTTQVWAFLTISGAKADAKVGTPCHELGHLLFGFPDLYDTKDPADAGIGEWGVMGGGNWLGDRNRPCHPSAWCKVKQGWVTVKDIAKSGDITIDPVVDGHTVYRIAANRNHPDKEYFLLENRQQKLFDSDLNGHGLLIWHIDDSKHGNTNSSHPAVRLLQADGRNDLLTANRGDAGDPYPGIAKSLTNTSNPPSTEYDGGDSGVRITNVSESGGKITAHVEVVELNWSSGTIISLGVNEERKKAVGQMLSIRLKQSSTGDGPPLLHRRDLNYGIDGFASLWKTHPRHVEIEKQLRAAEKAGKRITIGWDKDQTKQKGSNGYGYSPEILYVSVED